MYSRTTLIWINRDGELSIYAGNPEIGFFFENRLHWQFKVEKISTNCCFSLLIYLRPNKTLILNSFYVFDNWGKI